MPRSLEALDVSPVIYDLAVKGVATMARRHGKRGTKPLPYHNDGHILDVIEMGDKIATIRKRNGKLSEREHGNLIIAFAWHDDEQDHGSGANEEISARRAIEAMSETGQFDEADYRQVHEIIPATITSQHDCKLTQNVSGLFVPLKEIMADADLSALGRRPSEYWDRALNLFEELHVGEPLRGVVFQKFAADQVEILKNHRFYTPEARETFHFKDQNIAYAELVAYQLPYAS